MRRAAVLLFALALAMLADPAPGAKPKGARPAPARPAALLAPDTSAAAHQVTAYYFHGNLRCASCMKIEAYSKEAIEQAFAAELKDGRLAWRVVNTEEKGNEHFVKDYQLYTKSLVLVDAARGRQVRWKNLEKVWQYLQDKPAFLQYVRAETRAYLGRAS